MDTLLRLNNLFKNMDINKLCESFELTNDKNGIEIPKVREWIMDELEKRNPEAFLNWMNAEDVNMMDYPSNFFKDSD